VYSFATLRVDWALRAALIASSPICVSVRVPGLPHPRGAGFSDRLIVLHSHIHGSGVRIGAGRDAAVRVRRMIRSAPPTSRGAGVLVSEMFRGSMHRLGGPLDRFT